MPAKKSTFKYKKERVLLSDVLPYEVPLSFSNRHFYNFVLENKIESLSSTGVAFHWQEGGRALSAFIHILFSLPINANKIINKTLKVKGNSIPFTEYSLSKGGGSGKKPITKLSPYSYKINHKKSEFRELTIPHPRSQMSVVQFYDRHKETILYYTEVSNFSLRKPNKISTYKFLKDRLHYNKLADKDIESTVEEHGSEHENLKSFFSYKLISNIHKFYESYLFHTCEKRYDKLEKLDISKCFDSIYTHSIVWAVLGKSASKEDIKNANKSFSGRFDALMQQMHYGETNGIIIGPEFCRIFAEVILQRVDKNLEERLAKLNEKLLFKRDYEIYRYVDDYFVFYNKDEDKNVIVKELQHLLKEYKLSLNHAKATPFTKPIITNITIAKKQISRLLNDEFIYKLKEEDANGKKLTFGSISINANSLITAFKTQISVNEVEYKDLLNYTFAVIEKKIQKILVNYHVADKKLGCERQLVEALMQILEFVFFIYAVSPKVNTTIKLCRVIRIICDFLNGVKSKEYTYQIHKFIFDELSFVIKKNKMVGYSQIETLYLLIALSQMGKAYWLEEDVLREYLNLDLEGPIDAELDKEFDYFCITVSLFYIKNKKRYKTIRERIEEIIFYKVSSKKHTRLKDAELTMLTLDTISCPYVSDNLKRKLLNLYGVRDTSIQNEMLTYKTKSKRKQLWFTNWEDFNFGKELDAKQSQEVY